MLREIFAIFIDDERRFYFAAGAPRCPLRHVQPFATSGREADDTHGVSDFSSPLCLRCQPRRRAEDFMLMRGRSGARRDDASSPMAPVTIRQASFRPALKVLISRGG